MNVPLIVKEHIDYYRRWRDIIDLKEDEGVNLGFYKDYGYLLTEIIWNLEELEELFESHNDPNGTP